MDHFYHPPDHNALDWISHYEKLIEKMTNISKHVVVGLDHNLDLLKTNVHKGTQSFLEKTIDLGLLPCITKPTRITHHSATLIDNILVSENLYTGHLSYVIAEDISDHLPGLLSLPSLTAPQKESVLVKKRRLNEKAVESIKNELTEKKYSETLSDVNEAFIELHDSVLEAINKSAPEKSVRKKAKQHNEPWIRAGICNSLRKQRKLYREINKPGVATCKHMCEGLKLPLESFSWIDNAVIVMSNNY